MVVGLTVMDRTFYEEMRLDGAESFDKSTKRYPGICRWPVKVLVEVVQQSRDGILRALVITGGKLLWVLVVFRLFPEVLVDISSAHVIGTAVRAPCL